MQQLVNLPVQYKLKDRRIAPMSEIRHTLGRGSADTIFETPNRKYGLKAASDVKSCLVCPA